ncbi:MAG: DegV family EDD domain-containing protein [Lachnospiraceae bacterium]|nr:DegV family EDD domain-containing protein [Lachnospiraceae bacterium]
MRLKDLLGVVNDKNKDIQERLLMLVTLIAIVALIAVFIGGLFVGETVGGEIVIGLAIVVFGLIIYFSARHNKLRTGANISSLMIVFLVIPFTFFTSGGIYGGAPLWIILCAVFITMTTKGRVRFFLWISETIVTAACYFIGYHHPEYISAHSAKTAYMDSLMSVVVVGSMISMMIGFSIRAYRAENLQGEKQRKEIDELNRAQNQFFSNMSHEIRTPINSIIGLNEMILREDNISKEVAENARNIQSASHLLLHIINDILDMSKIESGNIEIRPVEYSMEELLSDVIGMIEIRASEKDLSLLVSVDPNLPSELYGDEVKIKQILINILTNAVKYTKEGSVSLSIQFEKREGNELLVIFSVADTGIGIKKENIPYLFSAFRRMDTDQNRNIEGTGLGLAIVKEFTELMDGSVKVNSVYMQGSTFVVEIPQHSVSAKVIGNFNMHNIRSKNNVQYRKSFEAPEAKILVVDDNAMNLMVAKKLLKGCGAVIDTANDGEEALQKTMAQKYDLIFMDHLMPEMDGIECFHRIREQIGGHCNDTKVCILTANSGSDKQAVYMKEGFDGYLLKPVNSAKLEEEVIRLLPSELVHILDSDIILSENEQFINRNHQKKLPVIITADSICDLPDSLLKQNGISTLPYHVRTERGVFLDGIETEAKELIAFMKENSGFVRSEAPEVEEYELFFSENLKRANNIIHITMAKDVSSGYSRALEAAGAFDNVTVIDSGHLSSSMGIMILEAARMVQDGQPVERVAVELIEMRSKLHTSFIVEDTSYLARAGRINPFISRLTNAFMLHPMPVLFLRDSKLKVGRICFGTRESARKKYIYSALNTTHPIDKSMLFITSAGLSTQELKQIEKEVSKIVSFDKILFQKASSAINVNCGPGSFGLLFKTVM